jgi:hypothetical protein
MPILRRRVDGGYIIRGFVRGADGFCTWQVSEHGESYLKTRGIKPDGRLASDVFQYMIDKGWAFTGKSGIIEAQVTPETLADPLELPHPVPDKASIDEEDAKIFSRWLPRLTDRSTDVRTAAGIHLGQLAIRSITFRDRLVPLLLDFTAEEKAFYVLSNGLYSNGQFGLVVRIEPKWLEAFVDVFLDVGAPPDYKQFVVWRELAAMVVGGLLTANVPLLERIGSAARLALPAATDLARESLFAVVDWVEDHT